MESTMVMSRNQIEDWRQKAQQKRKQKASQRQVKKSKRISKGKPKGVDSSKSEDVMPTDLQHVVNVSDNDMTPTDSIFLEDQISDQTGSQFTYVSLDCFLNDLDKQQLTVLENTHNLNTLSFEDVNPQTTSSTETTIENDTQHVTQFFNGDQDGLIEMIESLLSE